MAMSDTVQDRQDARRRDVLAAAASLYAERGYRATSMNDLAAHVGLSKPALYHYVSKKEEVLSRLYADVLRDNTAAVAEIEATSATAIAALRAVLVQRVAYTCANQALLTVFFHEEAGLPPDELERVLAERRAYDEAVLAIVERAVAEGSLTLTLPPRLYVNTVLGAANWVYKWFDSDGRLPPDELGEVIAEVLLGPAANGTIPRGERDEQR